MIKVHFKHQQKAVNEAAQTYIDVILSLYTKLVQDSWTNDIAETARAMSLFIATLAPARVFIFGEAAILYTDMLPGVVIALDVVKKPSMMIHVVTSGSSGGLEIPILSPSLQQVIRALVAIEVAGEAWESSEELYKLLDTYLQKQA